MNTIRQLCAGTILGLMFAVPVMAGDIDSPGKTPTPPPSTSTSTATGTSSLTTTVILTIVSLIYR